MEELTFNQQAHVDNMLVPRIPWKSFAAVLLVYFVLGAFLVDKYLPNADAVSYISIAQKYAHGDFKAAINGFWSPLFSWLLAPFLFLRFNPIIMSKILCTLSGGLLLWGIFLLSSRFMLSPFLSRAIEWGFIPIVLYYARDMINPDCLVAALLVLYFFLIFDPAYTEKKCAGPACTILGSLAFFAKSYAFFFFLLHFSLFSFLHYLHSPKGNQRKAVLAKYVISVLVFSLISGGWIAALSLKYRKLTISTAGGYNFAVIAPRGGGEPPHYDGFIAPPNSTAVSAWEDPTVYPRVQWSPFESRADFSYWLNLLKRNTIKTLAIFQSFSFLALPILFVSLLLSFWINKHRLAFFSGLTVVLYCYGYISLLTLERYLWVEQVLLFLLGGYLINLLIKQRFFSSAAARSILTSLLVLTFLILPVKFLVKNHNHFYIDNLEDTDRGIYRLSKQLKGCCPIYGNVASDRAWNKTLFLAYYLDLNYYGQKSPRTTPAELEEDLEKSQIDYYFLWSGNPEKYDFLRPEMEITRGRFPGLEIFRIRPVSQ